MKSKDSGKNIKPSKSSRLGQEVKGLFLLLLALLLLLCLCSFEWQDPAKNWLGLLGYCTAFALNFLFGYCSFVLAIFCAYYGFQTLCGREIEYKKFKLINLALFTVSLSILLSLIAECSSYLPPEIAKKVYCQTIVTNFPYPQRLLRCNLGGVPFYFLYRDAPGINLQLMLSNFGVALTFTFTALISFAALIGIEFLPLFKKIGLLPKLLLEKIRKIPPVKLPTLSPPVSRTAEFKLPQASSYQPRAEAPIPMPPKERTVKEKERKAEEEKPIYKAPASKDFTSYQVPPSTLLSLPKKMDTSSLKKELGARAAILEETLRSFGIEAKVGEIHCGPTITSFEVHPSVGVKVQKIKALENDIALNLQAKSIRIIAPIPGKAAVGVEVPSLVAHEVSFREMLEHYQDQPRKMHIPVLLGKSVSGENVISDLAKMPHCIIAGATGSGKSVCINTIILSILMNARPDEIKLLMVDPKKVELSAYTRLPHMIAPVITEPHGAYAALNWLVKEMQNRYDLLKQLGLRNINAFNERTVNKELEESLGREVPASMYWIVAVIDEFADLMMVSSSDLETPIARIAQMARAVGIHLILATQRPSREVITGLIKANFPTRISFKVSSRINSQIVLDDVGAESLLGNGDMLFLPPGSSSLLRAQGAYISDNEINKIIKFIGDQAGPAYLIPSFDRMTQEDALLLAGKESEADEPKDSLFDEAMQIVLATQTASTTFLQRKLKIGYARAASLIDELEHHGVVGPAEGAKPRQILKSLGLKQTDNPVEEV